MKKFFLILLAFLSVVCAVADPAETRFDEKAHARIRGVIAALRDNLPDFSLSESATDPAVLEYFAYYDIDFPVHHSFGKVDVDGADIVAHAFIPEDPVASVVVAHGYFDHVGAWKHAIRYFLDRQCAVVAFDFYGHGLSEEGGSGYVEDFDVYLASLRHIAGLAESQLPRPVHLVGHSMGAGVICEYVLREGVDPEQRLVFISPNIRSSKWWLSRIASALVRPFTKSVPRAFRGSSHDETFLEFREFLDPLQPRRIPIKWFTELVEWNREIKNLEPVSANLLIIQGTSDGTTDWMYNTRFLPAKFPGLSIEMIEGGEHHLINEVPPMRYKTLKLAGDFLEGQYVAP